MRILIVGSWVTTVYEEPLYNSLKSLSQEVFSFKWGRYFSFSILSNNFDVKNSFFKSLWFRFQNKYLIGPAMGRINRDLLKEVKKRKPDVIFFYRPTHIWPSTIRKIKKTKTMVFIYNNDDPFTNKLPWYVYRYFLKSIFLADWTFSYRESNILRYKELGLFNISLLKSNYIKSKNFHLPNTDKKFDVIFIGHYEDDGRDEKIMALINTQNIKVCLWGTGWRKSKYYDLIIEYLGHEITPIFGEEYNLIINQSKIALVFFSKINNDTYTRRCFEIPATKTFMLCEYSQDIVKMYSQGVEADFFQDTDDLLKKAIKYLNDHSLRTDIAQKGHERVLADGHEVEDRAMQVIMTYRSLLKP